MSKAPPEVQQPTIYGTGYDDVIDLNPAISDFYGLGGDDVFVAHVQDSVFNGAKYVTYDQYIHGGSGSDTLTYTQSNKKISANLGTGLVNRYLDGEVWNTDHLTSIENLTGSAYNDTIHGSSAANRLRGFGGRDTVYGHDGNDQLWGDSGNDFLDGLDDHDTIDGGTGNDEIEGGAGHDSLNGGSGNDKISGQAGNDRLIGGSGNDTMDGGADIDTVVYGGWNAATVHLWLGSASDGTGTDTLSNIENVETGSGDDIVFGSYSSNRLSTGGGNDIVYALDGDDSVFGEAGADTIYGYEGNDRAYGGSGSDKIYGGADDDTLYGEGGNDVINGEAGDDKIYGGDGNDRMRGGDGADTITGGSGADVVVWQQGDSGMDTIAGFNLAEDRLYFGQGFFALEPVGNVDLSDVLTVFDSGNHAVLAANTEEGGWVAIATLLDVDAYALGQMIMNESILAPGVVVIGGGPGDFT